MSTAPSRLDPRTPVIVAVGQTEQRPERLGDALEPTALLAEAARRATDGGSGGSKLLQEIDTIAVIRILSHRYRDPGRSVADHLGIAPARTIETDDGGNYPQLLVSRACREILSGASDTWLIGGAETWRTRTTSRRDGTWLDWTVQDDRIEPTERLANPLPLAHPGEWERKVFLPIEIYPLFENAYRAARGWSIDEHRDRIAQLYARFSEVAATNPHAWIQRTYTSAELRDATPDNRMVGFPYTKLVNANNAVEQAACVLITSVGTARDLGISPDRWVFPWSGADAHEHWFVSNRWSLAESPAIGIAGRAALDLAGVGVDDLAHVDVYSCFPSAVQIAAREIGLDPERSLTVTGGLSFAGGPWNNYVSHSIATMAERLRADEGAIGLVTANGGYLTKHAMGVYSATPPITPFRHSDPQPEVDALPKRELAEVVDAEVVVESAVVVHDRDSQPERALVSGLLADGRRAWGATDDPDEMERFTTEETSGAGGRIDPSGRFRST